MKPDHYFHVADPKVIGQPDTPMLLLQFETLDGEKGVYKRTGKILHLELTAKFAMELMGSLRQAQIAMNLPDPGTAGMTEVPPHNKRN